MIRTTTRDRQGIAAAVDAGEAFRTSGALAGTPVAHGYIPGGYGRMGIGERAILHMVGPDVDYVIMSYGTPIAYRVAGVWYMPVVTYSVTTSRHQSVVRGAVGETLDSLELVL